MRELRWGIVGPGEIAGDFAQSLITSGVGHVARVCGRSVDRSTAFCARYQGRLAADLDDLLDDDDVDAIYVATPHPAHARVVRRALEAGRPVLCEKPMSVSPATTRGLFDLAAQRSVTLMEAWMYRCHPQIRRLVELRDTGTHGPLRRIRSWFGFAAPFDPESRLYSARLGGGGILDVGGYPLSLALCLGGSARIVRAAGSRAETGVDASAEVELALADGSVADLSVSITEPTGCGAVVDFERARVVVENPFVPSGDRHARLARLRIEPVGGPALDETSEAPHDCYALEALAFAELVAKGAGRPTYPLVSPEESIAIAELQAAWREAVGASPALDFD